MSAPELRGRCRELSEAACAADPTLVVVRGWYHDPHWGAQEHWWCKRPDGSIVDPTSAQFPMGGVADWYEEFAGTYPCWECGEPVTEERLIGERFCSGECYGRCVGVL